MVAFSCAIRARASAGSKSVVSTIRAPVTMIINGPFIQAEGMEEWEVHQDHVAGGHAHAIGLIGDIAYEVVVVHDPFGEPRRA